MKNLRCNSIVRCIAWAIPSTLLLNGCATDQQRTRTEGATGGAVLGALIGAALGGRNGAIAGAAVGAGGGALVGNSVAKKKQGYAEREAALRDSVVRSQALAAQTRQKNTQLSGQIAELQRNIQSLQAQKVSAIAKQTLLADRKVEATNLIEGVDVQIQRVADEIGRQQALIDKERRLAMQTHDNSLAPHIQQVADGVRDLQSNQRDLELARAQLQLIEQKRAY